MAARAAFNRIDNPEHQDVDVPNFTRASDAADDADAAYMDASAANTAAMAADVTVEAAQQAARDAVAAKDEAEAAQAGAEMYSDPIVAYVVEADALSDAQGAAMVAAGEARMKATAAQGHADKVAEILGASAMAATTAQGHATDADNAATMAETAANMAAGRMHGMSEDAKGDQETAEMRRDAADDSLVLVAELEREAQIASDASSKQQEERDIADAQDAAKAAAGEAMGHYEAAMGKAVDARTQATNARASADRAARARTDATNADTQATAAETAATEAEAARGRADTANADAQAAYMSAMGATNSDDAEMYRDNAVEANERATEEHTGMTGAGMAYMRAETAAGMAEMYANTHVLGLFMRANAYDIDTAILDDSGTPEANEAMTVAQLRATEVASIGVAMAASAMADSGNQRGAAQTSAAWAADNPETADVDESAAGLTISVTSLSVDVTSDTMGDADADPVVMANASNIDGVGDFMHGFDIANGEVRVLAFTDREQAILEVAEVTAVTFQNVDVDAVGEIDSLGESTDGGKTYPGKFDDGTNGVVEGTFTCGETCSLVYTGTGDEVAVQTAEGVTFSGRRAAKAAVTADENMDYLLFGLWLDEAANDDDSFGAFGGGGQEFTSGNVNGLTGTASYSGEAVGAHHKTGSGVSWFDGDASLTANFGEVGDAGTIEGSISNISVDGGDAMTNPIHLVRSTIDGNNFNGTAVMGAQTRPGEMEHSYNGTWSGGFFNNPAADATGNDAHPESVAGTFGVTRDTMEGEGDDAMSVTESFVGAFGAHR